jgi:thymidylate synthase (FAD)
MYNDEQFDRYNLLKQTMPKEQARSILPLGTYTKFYWTVNGRSLMNFLKLRLDKGAQAEIREYAKVILDMAKVVAPVSFTEFVQLVLKD